MLAFSLTDSTDANDPCTPGSPTYNPSDPVCTAFYAPSPTSTPPAPTDINFDTPVNVRTSCPTGYTLANGSCNLMLNPASAAPSSGAAASLGFIQFSWWWVGLLAVAGIGGWYAYGKHVSKSLPRG